MYSATALGTTVLLVQWHLYYCTTVQWHSYYYMVNQCALVLTGQTTYQKLRPGVLLSYFEDMHESRPKEPPAASGGLPYGLRPLAPGLVTAAPGVDAGAVSSRSPAEDASGQQARKRRTAAAATESPATSVSV